MKPKRKNRTRLSLDIDDATKGKIKQLQQRYGGVSITDAIRIAVDFLSTANPHSCQPPIFTETNESIWIMRTR